MPKPVLLTVDDDPEVLRAIERDLRSRYADRYRIMRANSGSAGLATLRELKARNNPVALLLADQRMPQMDGVNFLTEAMEMHPLAKRALLTAYADTNAAIDAINEARVHYYLMKPWDPPEEKLFPALDDLLHDWTATYRPLYEGIRVLGTRWSNRSYELREFLARNQVPYQWIDVELAQSDPEVRGLIDSLGPEAEKLPLILFPDGTRLPEPPLPAVADKIGLRTHAQTNFYDLAIVGGGPAGLAAAVYGASEGLRTVIVEREAPGGQAGLSSRIETHWPGPGAECRRAGAALRRGDPLATGSGGSPRGGPVSVFEACGRFGDFLQRAAAGDGRSVENLGRSGDCAIARSGRFLRRWNLRSAGLQGRNRVHHWRREFRRAGGHALFEVCGEGGGAGARRVARRHHVALLDRANRKNTEYRGMAAHQRRRCRRRIAAHGNYRRVLSFGRKKEAPRVKPVHFYRRAAAHGMDGRLD